MHFNSGLYIKANFLETGKGMKVCKWGRGFMYLYDDVFVLFETGV
jgi:hypothetical protein